MDKTTLITELETLLEAKNYLAVCLRLKDADLDAEGKRDVTGRIASRIVDDLTQTKNRERVTYLRSLLVWLFKDVPGLSQVYREQLRLSAGVGKSDLFGGLQTLSELAKLGGGGREDREGFAEDVKQRMDEASERFSSGEVQDQVNEFLSQAGQNVENGIKRAADFFESLNRGPRTGAERRRPERDSDEGGQGDEPGEGSSEG